MCKYTLHRMRCAHEVVKVLSPCHLAYPNPEGLLICDHGPLQFSNAHVCRNTEEFTYGPGVCANIACRIEYGLLPHDYTGDGKPYLADEEPFDMSPATRIESERRWHSQMTPENLEWLHLQKFQDDDYRRHMLPPGLRNLYNKIHIHTFEAIHLFRSFKMTGTFEEYMPEWWAMNPRYMTAFQLYNYTPTYLDVWVANPGAEDRGPPALPPALVSLLKGQEDLDMNMDMDMDFAHPSEMFSTVAPNDGDNDPKDHTDSDVTSFDSPTLTPSSWASRAEKWQTQRMHKR